MIQSTETPTLVKALKGEPTDRVPVWFMRQAGRYLPEYNRIRQSIPFLELTQNPELATEISIQPHARFGLDGIIMFSDILTPLHGAGVPLHFEEKRGPVLELQIQEEKDLAILDRFDPEKDTSYVAEILDRLRIHINNLATEKPALLGFAGAPFTLASYLVEGGTSRKFEVTKSFLWSRSKLFHKISERLAQMTVDYLLMQISHGADAVQIFDSWGGILAPDHYKEFSAPYIEKIIQGVRKGMEAKGLKKTPIILFVGNSAHLLAILDSLSPDAVSLDWRVSRADVDRYIFPRRAIQGNMDPLVLYGNVESVERETRAVLESFANRPGYVFNLGHGIHPAAPVENVERMIATVRSWKV